ncbi:PR-1-like protein [Trametes versicolor FP-101664 SS1]|uniref:PR-1-like protein n=1 Tax=Trametes versicolor (strain FP-101664) TaxID=717944 RepID=UPI0004623EC2|nr:PR-1-like protein [Trametes versicolor FP-101664 SS1]EIW64740.1 PR-1-like protein [Trametes versicolor FP-101664 SS1]
MNRLVYFLAALPLLLVFTTSADAGPACARRNEGTDACIAKCGSKWGWPGSVMGTDRWGQVLTKTTTDDMGAVVTKACRVRSTGLASASTTSIASSTSVVSSPTVAPANVIVSASVSTVTPSSSSSASLRALTKSSSASKKVSLAPLVTSSTAPATTTHSTTSVKPTTTSTKPKPAPATTSTSSTEAPSPPPETTTTTKKTTTKQAAPTTTAASTQSQSSSGDSGSSNNNNGNSGNSGSSSTGSGSSSSSGATSQSDIDQYLSAHNTIRAQHGASPLTWSDDLAAKAQQWANGCVFQHSGGTLGPFGENLAAGTGSSYGIASAVKSWTDEVSEYDSSNPVPSHFTQVVWKASTQVGCAVQSCNGIFAASFGPAKFFVCEYSPQGNVIGQFGQNVQA